MKKTEKKIAKKKAKIKAKLKTKLAKVSVILLLLSLAGCQSADPATRSGAATYGDIIMNYCTNCSLTIGDGAILDASGGGDSNSNTPSQETSPSFALPGDAISTGIAVAGNVLGKAIDSGKTTSGTATQTIPAGSAVNCTDGSCIPVAPATE